MTKKSVVCGEILFCHTALSTKLYIAFIARLGPVFFDTKENDQKMNYY